MRTRCAMGVTATALAGWFLLWVGGRAAPVRQPAPAAAASGLPPGFAGAGSCSGQGCHGRTEPIKDEDAVSRRNEYTLCVTYDKHLRAYQVLKEKRAKVMAANLAPTNADGKAIEPTRDQRCLACHSTPEAAHQPNNTGLDSFRAEGVSCEACHGPSKKEQKSWFARHTTKSWHDLKPDKKAEYGFTDLGDLQRQAKTCAGCHVGAPPDKDRGIPARDVNHDIMAAGHPRLNFELTTFRANMPPHWNVARKEKSHKPGAYEAKSWAVGQVVSARAALDLLLYRSEQAEKDRQKKDSTVRWPEFAEYRCFACHADLHPEWRNRKAPPGRLVGSLPYDPWYNCMLPGLFPADLAKEYQTLASNMAQPQNQRKIGEQAEKIRDVLKGWLGQYKEKDYVPANMLKDMLQAAGKPDTWEHAEQLVLAIAALKRAEIAGYLKQLKSDPNAKMSADLAALEEAAKALAFPAKAESPAGFTDPFAAKSPAREKVQSLLDKLRK